MSNLYWDLKVISDYLSNSLEMGRIIFSKKYIENNNSHEPIIENFLFKLYYREIEKEENQKQKIVFFSFSDLENTFIAKHLIKENYGIELCDYSKDYYYFETTGLIPYRWLLIIYDFYWKDSTVEKIGKINYHELLEKIPDVTLNQILVNSKNTKLNYSIKVNSEENKVWYTKDGLFSPYAKSILEDCNSYFSLEPTSKFNYEKLFASEGGIKISNIFINEYMKYNHNYQYSGSYRNEVKGNYVYQTGKDINREELLCLYLALFDKGVSVIEKNISA